jgi:hypothetical protein
MLKKELLKKTPGEIQKIRRFWEMSEHSAIDDIIRHMTKRDIFALSCSSLDGKERALLYSLLCNGGLLLKGDLHKMYESDIELDATLEGLTQKSFVYLRKNRRLLNDRLDKVYLFPELLKHLKTYRVYEPGEVLDALSQIVDDWFLLQKESVQALTKIVMHGGVVPVRREQSAAYMPLYEERYVDIAFLAEKGTFIPIWILSANVRKKRTGQKSRTLSFGQSLYVHDVVKSIDCMLYLSLKKTHAQKTFSTCLKFVPGGEAEKSRCVRDLELLGVLREENEKYMIDESFAKKGYTEKIAHLKNVLSEDERRILAVLKKKENCTRESLFSLLMREHMMKELMRAPFSESFASERLARYTASLEDLVFRGFALCDTTGAWVKANSMQKNIQSGDGSVVVNTDRELMVFADRISHFHLYVLTGFSNIVQRGEVIRLSIDRDSISRGIEYIGDAALFSEVLRRTAGTTVNEGVLGSINRWSASKIDVKITRSWVIHIDSEKTRLKLLQNRYIQTHIEHAFDTLVVLKAHTDMQRLKRELRKENIFIRVSSQ